MQSALGSLRSAGPSRCYKQDEVRTLWGVGSDGLCLSGTFRFRVLKGGISVCGTTLTTDDATYHQLSASVAPYPTFRAVHLQNSLTADIPGDFQTFVAVIEVSIEPSLFPDIKELAPPFKSLWHPLVKIEPDIPDSLRFEIPSSWREVEVGKSKRWVVLGPKNSGKSSFCRYITNQHLQAQYNVYYLELDPGQPEFTPPGNLSLHLCSQLNFSPAYAHAGFGGIIKSVHLGYTSPMETPHRYLDICENLLKTFNEVSKPKDVIVINTPGWTKGLGQELNSAIVNLAGYKSEVFHMGASEFDLVVTELEVPHEVGSTITTGGFSSAELRNLQIMCYMHQYDTSPITHWPPYDVPIGTESGVWAFAVMDSAGVNLPEDLRICVEGTLVSINLVPKNIGLTQICLNEFEANDIWRASTSVGMAVVQSLDRTVRLLTPLDVNSLDLLNNRVVLVRGRISLPSWEITDRAMKSSVPWVSTDKPVGIGGSYTKFRRNIQRN